MNFTFRQLKLFESVARNLSFTRASEELYLTQPAVSTQIKQLESEVGTPLFERLGKKIYLTEAGREMYEFSRSIAQKFSDVSTALDEMKGIKRGHLNIAVTSTAKYFAPYLIAAKTGTAQVVGIRQNEKYNASRMQAIHRDHALFIAFAPADAPKIAIAVLVENGGHGGTTAAPIARAVMDYYLLGKLPKNTTTRPTDHAGDNANAD